MVAVLCRLGFVNNSDRKFRRPFCFHCWHNRRHHLSGAWRAPPRPASARPGPATAPPRPRHGQPGDIAVCTMHASTLDNCAPLLPTFIHLSPLSYTFLHLSSPFSTCPTRLSYHLRFARTISEDISKLSYTWLSRVLLHLLLCTIICILLCVFVFVWFSASDSVGNFFPIEWFWKMFNLQGNLT